MEEVRKKKVLFLFSVGFDIEHSSTILMTNVLEDAFKKDMAIHYIIPNETGNNKNCPESLLHNEYISYSVIHRKTVKKNRFVLRYVEGIWYALKCAIPIYKLKIYDVIYIQSTPTAFWNILIARIFGHNKPIIYSVLDMFPGSTIASGVMPQKIVQKFFYCLQKKAYNMATHIMTLSYDMKNEVIKQGVSETKITYFNTWFNEESLINIKDEDNKFITEFNMDKNEYFYVQYAGNIGYVYDLDLFLKVVEGLKNYKKIKFQLVARGSQLERLISLSKKKNLDNIEIIPIQPVDRIAEVYSSCDIQFIPLKQGIMGNSFPSKLAHVMQCKKTFICSTDKDTNFYSQVNKHKIGICTANSDYLSTINSIIYLYENKKILREYEEKAYIYSKNYFSREKNTDIILNTINKVIRYKK